MYRSFGRENTGCYLGFTLAFVASLIKEKPRTKREYARYRVARATSEVNRDGHIGSLSGS